MTLEQLNITVQVISTLAIDARVASGLMELTA